MQYDQLEELTGNRSPDLWLVGCEIDPKVGGSIKIQTGYLANGYGASSAVLVPVGKTYPRFTVAIHPQVRNLPRCIALQPGGIFTIEKIEIEANYDDCED